VPNDALTAEQAAQLGRLVDVYPEARELGERFAAAGHELYLVGGTVRDTLLAGGDADAVEQLEGVSAVGDIAAAEDRDGEVLPQLAPVAIQQGRYVGERLVADYDGRELPPFRYRDRGTMATVGRRAAVADLPLRIRLRGTLAWIAWLALHLLYLVGFKNRVGVLLSWLWNYVMYDHAARLILDQDPLPDELERRQEARAPTEPRPPR
jgi:hypothetical protein